jgi:hypothetical protein
MMHSQIFSLVVALAGSREAVAQCHVWGTGIGSGANALDGAVQSLTVWNDGSGPALYAGGSFTSDTGATLNGVAKWNGSTWLPLGQGVSKSASSGTVNALAVFDDGSGSALYAGGYFDTAGGVGAFNFARWDGASWSSVAGSFPAIDAVFIVTALLPHHSSSGSQLFILGAEYPYGRLLSWDGTSWSSLAVMQGYHAVPHALTIFDDGSGLALYMGGRFGYVNGTSILNIARWNGSIWSPLGSGIGNPQTFDGVAALATFDDGSGPALFAGGMFTIAGGVPAANIAKWNGSSWSPVGGGMDDQVFGLCVFDDGSGPALYAAGEFTHAGAVLANHIARWDGTSWFALGGGLDDGAGAMQVFDDGSDADADLYVAGAFTSADGMPSAHIAEWHGCGTIAFCFGDGSATACPCANSGLPSHGCDNSAVTGGALLDASGSAMADTVVLHALGELPSALSIFLQGNAQLGSPAFFGDGLRCVGGSLKRLYVTHASGGSASAPSPGDPSIKTRSAALGDPITPGTSRYYQVYYRDPSPTFCPPPQGDTFNVGNALRVLW